MSKLNEAKYQNAILYFAQHTEHLAKTKLFKLLYFLDFDYYHKSHSSITGEQYSRWDKGPVPCHGADMVNTMEEARLIKITLLPTHWGVPMGKITPLQEPDDNVFSESERLMLRQTADKWRLQNAKAMISATHNDPPWLLTQPNDVIDYDLVFYRNRLDSDVGTKGGDEMNGTNTLAQLELAKAQSLRYAERIEYLWDNDPVVRTRIERGVQQMESGQLVPVSIGDLLKSRRRRANLP